MKAIRYYAFGGPEVLKLETVSDPTPGTGQVVVNVAAIGVNPVDTYIRSGVYGDRTFPVTPGMDAAGTIESVGPGVQAFKPGDRVYLYGTALGTYAEKVLADADQVFPLPDRLSMQQGAAIGVPVATAYFALFNRGGAREGETVLVHGASGGVGTAAVQLARGHGLKVYGTAGSPEGRALVERLGAAAVLDHQAPDYLEQLMKLTSGRGVDLVVEMLANVNLAKDLTVLAPRGRVVVVGSRGKIEIDPRETMKRNADIRGMSLVFATPEEVRAIHAALAKDLAAGALQPVIDEELPLSDAAKAHEAILQGSSHGKIILKP
jgi:NADPH:quinone reductase